MSETSVDLPKALDEVRREVVEARNMTIKTDNALKTLHAELKNVSAAQETFQRRTWFSTAAAYLGFATLCAVGAFALSGAKASSARVEVERLEAQVAALEKSVADAKAEVVARQTAEQSAMQVFKMMTTLPGDERLKGVDALAKLDQSTLPPFARQVLNERAEGLRQEVGAAIYERGKAAFRRQEWGPAAEHLTRFLAMNPPESEALEASFFLGNSLFQARKFADAIGPLTRFVEGDKRARVRDFAMLMLSQSHDMVGNRDQGYAVAKEALASYPSSDFRSQLSARASRGGSKGAAATPAPESAPAAPPAVAPSSPSPAP